jgi:tRNA pseudouridine-54 N-methylase
MDAYLVFFRRPLRAPGKQLQPRGYASRYSRLDVLARIAISLAEMLEGFNLYAFIPLEDEDDIVPIMLRRECPISSERMLTLDIVSATIGGSSRCFHRIDRPPELLIKEISHHFTLVLLEEGGADISKVCRVSRPIAWALGGHLDPPEDMRNALLRHGAEPVSVGPLSYLSSHVALYTAFARRACTATA